MVVQPSHRKCQNCGLYVAESYVESLFEINGVKYTPEVDVHCPKCTDEAIPVYAANPPANKIYNKSRREVQQQDVQLILYGTPQL